MSKYKIKTDSGMFVFEMENRILLSITLPFLVDDNANYDVLHEIMFDEKGILSKFKIALETFLTGRFRSVDYSDISRFWKLSDHDFTNRVYQTVMEIPPGQTLSYLEVAYKSGSAGAYQAVGNIMRNNPYPLLIPCHRVIGTDGKMHGYAGRDGVQIKKRLIEWESRAVINPSLFKF